jgi:hypothetical protein
MLDTENMKKMSDIKRTDTKIFRKTNLNHKGIFF